MHAVCTSAWRPSASRWNWWRSDSRTVGSDSSGRDEIGKPGPRDLGSLSPPHRLNAVDDITILNAWRAAGLVVYDTDRALLTVKDIVAMRAIVEANQKR